MNRSSLSPLFRRCQSITRARSYHRALTSPFTRDTHKNKTHNRFWTAIGFAASIGYLSYRRFHAEETTATATFDDIDQEDEQEQGSEQKPEFSKEQYKYVLLGSGLSVLTAAQQIKDVDPDSKILIIATPNAIPSSQSLIKTVEGKYDNLFILDDQPKEWFEENKITYYKEDVMMVDSDKRAIILRGDNINRYIIFQNCLLASGKIPIPHPFTVDEDANIVELDSLDEAKKFREILNNGVNQKIAIIGGGLWECKLATSLATKFQEKGIFVEQIVGENGILGDILPPYLSKYLTKRYTTKYEQTLSVRADATVIRVSKGEDRGAQLQLLSGATVDADHAVAFSMGIPNCIRFDNFELDSNGVVVNRELRVIDGIYAAGEVASHYDPAFQRRSLQGDYHEMRSGIYAGKNIVAANGEQQVYDGRDIIEDEIAGIRFKAIGKCDSSLSTHSAWMKAPEDWGYPGKTSEEYHAGVVYYHKNNKVVGVLLWNIPDPQYQKETKAITNMKTARIFTDRKALVQMIPIQEQEVEEVYNSAQ